MKMMMVEDGVTYDVDDETGEHVKCPVCGTVWYTDCEGDVEFGECQHLRFYFCNQEVVDCYNGYDADQFKTLVEKAKDNMLEKDGCIDIEKLFNNLNPPGITEAIYLQFDIEPWLQPYGIWGFVR